MAVVVHVYGKADLKQIERAEKKLRDLKREVGSQGTAWQKFSSNMDATGKSMQGIGTKMSVGVTLPIAAGLAMATKAAVEEEAAMAQLEKALTNNVGATSKQVAATEEWITKTQNATGILDDELRPGLANLVRATKDVGKAQGLMGTAMDIAVAKGMPLETVTKAIAKAYQGNTTSLSRLGIETKDTAGKALDFGQAMKRAADTYGGAAATAADTTAGKLGIMRGKFNDMTETIGNDLIPLATDAMNVISPIIDKLASMPDWLRKLLLGVGIGAAAAGPLIAGAGSVLRGVSTIKGFAGSLKGGGSTGTVGVDKLGTSSGIAATEVATLGRAAAGASGKAAAAGTQVGTMGKKAQTVAQPLSQLGGVTTTTKGRLGSLGDKIRGSVTPSVGGLGTTSKTAGGKLGRFSGAMGNSTVGAIGGTLALSAALGYTVPKVLEAGDAFAQMVSAIDTQKHNTGSRNESVKDFRANVVDKYGSVEAYLAYLAKKYGKDSYQYKDALATLGLKYTPTNPIGRQPGTRGGGRGGAIGMADGGDYWVTRPTLFVAGEAGPERATFTPQGKAAPGGVVFNNCNFVGQDPRALVDDVTRGVQAKLREATGSGF